MRDRVFFSKKKICPLTFKKKKKSIPKQVFELTYWNVCFVVFVVFFRHTLVVRSQTFLRLLESERGQKWINASEQRVFFDFKNIDYWKLCIYTYLLLHIYDRTQTAEEGLEDFRGARSNPKKGVELDAVT